MVLMQIYLYKIIRLVLIHENKIRIVGYISHLFASEFLLNKPNKNKYVKTNM